MFKYGLITASSFLFLSFLTFSFASFVTNWHLFKKRNSEVNNLYSHRNFCKTFCVWFYVILVGSWARLKVCWYGHTQSYKGVTQKLQSPLVTFFVTRELKSQNSQVTKNLERENHWQGKNKTWTFAHLR